MKSIIKTRPSIFQALLTLLIVLSFVPIIILITQSVSNLNQVKDLSKDTIETTVREQTGQTYKSYAQNLAQRISDLLSTCELDLKMLSNLPADPKLFLAFSKDHCRFVNSINQLLPLYKEISLINANGDEIVKIIDDDILPKALLRNVRIPENTTYRSEKYFDRTLTNHQDIYVSHLAGWYISRMEQLEQGKSYDGVIRFCKRLTNSHGDFSGICMIALDHRHIMNFIWQEPIDKNVVIDKYKTGNYNYIVDDEGWIIAHPKFWDIRGLDKNGIPIASLSDQTPKWKFAAGLIPINLFTMDWRLHDIYTDEPMSSVMSRVQRGETVLTTMKSMGILGESEGIVRTRAYAPIHYSTGDYSKHGIFGAVAVGTSLEEFINKTQILTAQIDDINQQSKKRMLSIAAIISFAVLFFSFYLARTIAKPMRKVNESLLQIGEGKFEISDVSSNLKEITELSQGVRRLSEDLKEKDRKIGQYVKDLEVVNVKLAEAQKELDSYWKREYETESDKVLEEKFKFYEKEYPKFKEIKKTMCIGNSPEFLRVLRQIVPLSQMSIPTWIYGESGVGKTALAKAMHSLSPRSDKCFYVFEASEFAAADPMLVLGKLFGYGPGHGIRGIDKNGQIGIIEECDGGTLLVDDVDSLPSDTQVQLLRIVDGLHFHPAAGKTRNISSNVRFIFTTNVDLEKLVRDGLFRKDLFRRMGGSINKIEIPPLRKRKSDIPLLIDYFISQYCERNNIVLKISEEALNLLMNHDYPEGNIGELKMLLELACESIRIEGGETITEQHLPAVSIKNNHSKKKYTDSLSIFTENERQELEVLRGNLFRMEDSEQELGYKRGSRTLSHHLRGMCLKALLHSDWDSETATALIVDSQNSRIAQVIRHRIDGYVKNISAKVATSEESSLFKNLPKEYHTVLKESISHFASQPTTLS